MITWIIILIALSIITKQWVNEFKLNTPNLRDPKSCLVSNFFVIICSIVSIFIILSFPIWENNGVEIKRVNYQCNIFSLKNTETVEGKFVYGIGYINSQEYYRFFTKNDRGGLDRLNLNSGSCSLYQDEDKNPNIFWQDIYYRYPYWLVYPSWTWTEQTKYDVHVPSETIAQKFIIN